MDATQAISDSILESEEEENEGEVQKERGKPLAKLCILRNPHIPEKEFPLFLGDNVLGRDPNICTLELLAPSVSKQHATISISVYQRRGRDSEVDMEALVWDLGSMNGTRKGRLKLTPNVRYALSEGDTLVLGNIPCRYVSYRVESPSPLGDTGILQCRRSEANGRLSDSSGYKWNGVEAKRTPVTGGCLSFERTPVQPQGTLVPESDSDSESERDGRGDRKQRPTVSDSDSHKSSPGSSAFLSPPNKVVPESEDESPITPSSSTRDGLNRHVSFSLEKTDLDQEPQSLENNKSRSFGGNREKEAGRTANEGMYSEERGKNVKGEIGKSPGEDAESLGSTSGFSRDALPEFNLDSDTDVEGGEEEVVPAGLIDQPPNAGLFHMDSDTDVDEDTSEKAPTTSPCINKTAKPSDVASGIPLKGIMMDSDTDVEDNEDDANITSKATLIQGVQIADSSLAVPSGEFHLDSDTDVDEEEEGGTEAKQENLKTDEMLCAKVENPTPATPHDLHPDSDGCAKLVADLDILSESDTDLEEDLPPAVPAEPSVSSAAAPGAIGPDSDSDTDVDEPLIPRAGDKGKADRRMETDTDVVDEKGQILHLQRRNTPASLLPLLQKCSTPVHLSERDIEQMETQAFTSPASGAVTSSIGSVVTSSSSDSQEDEDYAVAETQAFVLQTRDGRKGLNQNLSHVLKSSAVQPEDQSPRGDSFQLGLSDSSHLQAEVTALAMENTQAYAAVDCGKASEETQAYAERTSVALEETQAYAERTSAASEETQAYAERTSVALEETQAFAERTSVALEETQAYAERTSAEIDPNLEATQPYIQDEEPVKCSEMSKKDGCVNLAFEATQAYISEPYDEGESVFSSTLAMAVTQPMSFWLEANNPVCFSEPVKTGVQNDTEEHQEEQITEAPSVAEMQPIFTSDNEQSDAKRLSAKCLKPAEEQKHPRTSSALCLAETQPICVSDGVASSDEGFSAESLQPAKVDTQQSKSSAFSLAETQPMCMRDSEVSSNGLFAGSLQPAKVDTQQSTSSHFSLAETQPLHASADEAQLMEKCEDDQNIAEDSEVLLPRKRKAKQLHIDEESQQHANSAGSQPVNPSEDDDDSMPSLRKRKSRPLEDETQSLVGSQVSAAESQPSATHEEEQSSQDFISSRKRKAKPLRLEDETQSLVGSQVSAAESQPSATHEEEQSSQDFISSRKRKARPLHIEDKQTQHLIGSKASAVTTSEDGRTQPKAACEDEGLKEEEMKVTSLAAVGGSAVDAQAEGRDGVNGDESMTYPRKRKEKRLHLEEETPLATVSEYDGTKVSPGTKNRIKQTKAEDDGNQGEVKVANQRTRGRRNTRKREEHEEEDKHKTTKNESQTKEQRDEKFRKDTEEPEETERHSEISEGPVEQLRLEEQEKVSEVSPTDSRCKTDEADEVSVSDTTETTDRGEEEEMARCSSSQNRPEKKENTSLASTRGRRGKSKYDNSSQAGGKTANQQRGGKRNTMKQEDGDEEDKNQSQTRERRDKTLCEGNREREHVETEREELIKEENADREQISKEMKSGVEIEVLKEANLESTKTDHDGEPEQMEQEREHGASPEKPAEQGEDENPKSSAKGRRAARRTTAAQREARPEQISSEDFPARRTRSRSNSSNSVGSERSVSQEKRGRGRGRGAKRSSEASQAAAAVRSSRRRTAAAAAEQDISKVSSSQNRGRPQGRGRKTLSQPDVGEQKASRPSTGVLHQDDKSKADSQLTGTRRGQRRVSTSGSEALVFNDEVFQSNQEHAPADPKSPLPKRNTRGRGPKAVNAEPMEEAGAPTASDGDEARTKNKAGVKEQQKEEIPASIQRRTSRASSTLVKKNEEFISKKEGEDGTKVAVGAAGRRGRGRTTAVQKTKTQELQETQASGSSMEQDGNEEESETLTVTPSRKRRVSSDSSPVVKTPRSSRSSPATVGRLRAGSPAYKVLFTGVVDESGERVLARLGGAMAAGIFDMNCLVTDKVRRTVKFLCALAKGVPVVTTHWLEKSGKAGCFLSPHAFIVKDPEQERKFNFSLQESLRTACNQPLLQGYEIHVTKSVKPEPVHMKDIITCSGATFLPRMPTALKPQTVVISCEEDLRLCGPAVSASLPVVTAEFILTGILQQRVDFQTHALSPSATNLQPAEGRRRGRKKT